MYRGTLGGRPVALQIRHADVDGSAYYYERIGLDIPLTAFRQGTALILQEEVRKSQGDDAVVTGCFTLRPTAAGLGGTWRAPGSTKTLAVTLRAVNVGALPMNLPDTAAAATLRRDDPLTFLKLNRLWVRAADGRSVTEPASQLVYPRVPGASAALNTALQDRQLRLAADALDCRSQLAQDMQRDPGNGYELGAKLTFQGARLVSVREDVYYYCGGAHPDTYTQGVILDRASGREVKVAQLWPGLTGAKQEALYLAHPAPDLDPACRDVLREGGLEFTAHLSPAGVNLTPTSLPHVVAACAETTVISYAEIGNLADTRSPYIGDLYKR
ncbi:hypothetical protein GCM10017781_24970 [Deinococcus metalli]|uniref:Uncharacterized protein n=1 Tax=Deinococcus metalli TaxID=1141878 RepID=A0ABQ3JP15_9DEIO|nr:hypothetical protein GCM10017781_24970 [Deinococcus metalli]